MPLYKNVASQKIPIYAYDTANSEAKTGDAANITAQISIDGGTTAATNDVNPTELDATDAPGVYIFDLTQAETNGDLIILSAASSTADIQIEPFIGYTDPMTETQRGYVDVAITSRSDFDETTDTVNANITQIEGATTVDNVSITNLFKRMFIALVRPFTANSTNRTKEFEDNTGSTEFTHTYDANNSRDLS